MPSICFVGPYPPIVCGIADYTSFVVRESPVSQCGVLSFDLGKYGTPITNQNNKNGDRVWYGIPGRNLFSASAIREGLKELDMPGDDTVLWFQHENGIWPDDKRFIAMLKDLSNPKVVTFHTLHYQSPETPFGLRKKQYQFLERLLLCVDAITVFSHGVYRSVTAAFPEYREQTHVIKHGIHSYPQISSLGHQKAKEELNHFLLNESELDQKTKEILRKQHIFTDPGNILLGQTGFLSPSKNSELLYSVKDQLQRLLPEKSIMAIRIGSPREASQILYAEQLKNRQNGRDKLFLDIWLPQHTLPLAQRAFNINFYWPIECTQSGVLAHALGAGAVIASRDLEGVGETVKAAGGLTDTDLQALIYKMRDLILDPDMQKRTAESALGYVEEFSWRRQSQRHYELVKHILNTKPVLSEIGIPKYFQQSKSFEDITESRIASSSKLR